MAVLRLLTHMLSLAGTDTSPESSTSTLTDKTLEKEICTKREIPMNCPGNGGSFLGLTSDLGGPHEVAPSHLSLSTHLAHPGLPLAHGLSPLHSLPQPPLACRRDTEPSAVKPHGPRRGCCPLAGFLGLLGRVYH